MFLGSVRQMAQLGPLDLGLPPPQVSMAGRKDHCSEWFNRARSTINLHKPSLTVICARHSKHLFILLAQPGERKGEGERHTALYDTIIGLYAPVNVKMIH